LIFSTILNQLFGVDKSNRVDLYLIFYPDRKQFGHRLPVQALDPGKKLSLLITSPRSLAVAAIL
jgi:hypothetical protein